LRQMLKSVFERLLNKLNGSNRVVARVDELGRLLDMSRIPDLRSDLDGMRVALTECLDRLADLEAFALENVPSGMTINTDHPVAIYSDDHKFPRGVSNDNSRHPRFVRAVEDGFKGKVRHLDLGCAGGGLVLDFLLRGHRSAGIEGSDFAKREQRAEWRVIPHHLFTADITKPFSFNAVDGSRAAFDVITAWEVLEHIPEEALPGLCANLRENLSEDGIFVGSIATFEDRDPETGAIWHVTVKPRHWWLEVFSMHGLEPVEGLFHGRDYVRGAGNPRVGPSGRWDWDAERNPEMGFHVTLRKRKG
jgi:SAM-dependent methyltransferase